LSKKESNSCAAIFLDKLQHRQPTGVCEEWMGQGDAPVKKLVLVLTIFLVTPAHADTVSIGWWDKSIGGGLLRCPPRVARSLATAEDDLQEISREIGAGLQGFFIACC
jgi:hypothetical protein